MPLAKKIRFLLHLVKAFGQKEKKIILLGIILGIASFLLLPRLFRVLVIKPGQRIAIVGRFTAADLPLEVQNLISDGLTAIDERGNPTPKLASFWETGNEGREYIFTLKDNLFWQDGKPLKAGDINLNFSDVATTALDDQRIKFLLKEPFSPFPVLVSRPLFKNGLLGTGKDKVATVKKNGQIIERIDLKPNLSYRFYPTEAAARTAFMLGEVDEIRELTVLGELANWRDTKIAPVIKQNRFVAVFFDTQNNKFADKSVRQAMAYAIKDHWTPAALNSINPASWAYNHDVKTYQYNLANAQKLLKKAAESVPALTSIELATIPSLISVAEQIKTDWQELGLETKVKIINNLDEGFEALLVAQEVPPDPDQYYLWHSTQTTNISRFKSPKIDNLLEEGRKTLDQDKRLVIYKDFQKALVEESPAIFLYHPTVYNISRARKS